MTDNAVVLTKYEHRTNLLNNNYNYCFYESLLSAFNLCYEVIRVCYVYLRLQSFSNFRKSLKQIIDLNKLKKRKLKKRNEL